MASRQELIKEFADRIYEETNIRPTPQQLSALNSYTDQQLQQLIDEHETAQIAKQRKRSELLVDIELKNQKRQQDALLSARNRWPDICRTLGISNCETNFNLAATSVREFTAEAIQEFITAGRLKFIPATAEELQETEAIEKQALAEHVAVGMKGHLVIKITGRQLYPGETVGENPSKDVERLKLLPVEQLRQLYAIVEHNRDLKQQFRAPQSQSTHVHRVQQETNSGSLFDLANSKSDFGSEYQRVPDVTDDGRKIDRAYLLKISRSQNGTEDDRLFRQLIKKCGYANINRRLQGKD